MAVTCADTVKIVVVEDGMTMLLIFIWQSTTFFILRNSTGATASSVPGLRFG